LIWSYDVAANGAVSNKTKVVDANDPGAIDGIKVDIREIAEHSGIPAHLAHA
jgi:sugar lactone lactonase YvrE